MSTLEKILPERQKRMKIAALGMAINYLIFVYGIHEKVDLTSLGTGLALVNAPLLTWILGESIRPTRKIETEIEK